MEQIGWFVVGGPNFGEYLFNNPIVHLRAQFIPLDGNERYWTNNGYTLIPAYVNGVDKEDYSFVGEEE